MALIRASFSETKQEAQHTLPESVQELLSPATLSALLDTPVSHVECRPIANHNGLAGGRLSYVETNNGRYVLKRMAIDSDWIMYASEDHHGRSVRLWQYGLLDRLSPKLEHQIIACARDEAGWAILMHDLSGAVFDWDHSVPADVVPHYLAALAYMHAKFWNDPILRHEQLGLCDNARLLDMTRLSVARNRPFPYQSPIPEWVVSGWQIMEDLLDRDVFNPLRELIEDPHPILTKLDRYPYTLLHGDFRPENLALLPLGQLVALDWQEATRSLMTIDLVWFLNGVRGKINREQGHRIYREHLEGYLEQRFDPQTWEEMTDLGYLLDTLRIACVPAYFSKHAAEPEHRAGNRIQLQERVQLAQNGLRWL